MTRERSGVQRPGNFRCAPVRGVTDGGQPPVSGIFAAGRRARVSDSLDVLAAVGRCRGGVIFLFIAGKAGPLGAGLSGGQACQAVNPFGEGAVLPLEHFTFGAPCVSNHTGCRFAEKAQFFLLLQAE